MKQYFIILLVIITNCCFAFSIKKPICSGVPTINLLNITADTSACPDANINISLTGTYTTGISFSWEKSFNNNVWFTLSDTTQSISKNFPIDSIYYRAKITCINGGLAYSNTIKLRGDIINNECYCKPDSNVTTYSDITFFQMGDLQQTSTCLTTGTDSVNSILNVISNYTRGIGKPIIPTFKRGGYYMSKYKIQTCNGNKANTVFIIYIDYNKNGIFDFNEFINNSVINSDSINEDSTLTYVSLQSKLGLTRMRVATLIPALAPGGCINFAGGEYEDYLVNIIKEDTCNSSTTNGVKLNFTDTSVCKNSTLFLSASLPSFFYTPKSSGGEWQKSLDGINWINTNDLASFILLTVSLDSVYYRYVTTCANGYKLYSETALIKRKPFDDCYCKVSANNYPLYAINKVEVVGTNLKNISGTVSLGASVANNTFNTTLFKEANYLIKIQTSGDIEYTGVWIDYNQNFLFETNEFSIAIVKPDESAIISVKIPATALVGKTLLRIRAGDAIPKSSGFPNAPITNATACDVIDFLGETEDYIINIDSSSNCNASSLIIKANDSLFCKNNLVSFEITNTAILKNEVITWENSKDALTWNTLFTNPSQLTYNTFTPLLSNDSNYYRAKLSCGSNSIFSNTIKIKPSLQFYNCYCKNIPKFKKYNDINSFFLGNSLNKSTCNSKGSGSNSVKRKYANYTYGINKPRSIKLIRGEKYVVGVGRTNCSTIPGFFVDKSRPTAFIDWNRDGLFATINERAYVSKYILDPGPSPTLETDTILVPKNASLGLTGLRVTLESFTNPFGLQSLPCTNFEYGEVEDYIVEILDSVNCSAFINPGTISANLTNFCVGAPIILSLNNYTTARGITFDWESSADATNWSSYGSNVAFIEELVPEIVDSVFFRVKLSCNNGAPVYSNVFKLAAITNFYNCYCNDDDQLGGECNSTIITGVNILNTSLNNTNNGCTNTASGSYTKFGLTSNTFTQLIKDNSYNLEVTLSSSSTAFAACYIDYNQDGLFDPSLEYTSLTINGALASDIINIPAGIQNGKTGLRIRYSGTLIIDACNQIIGEGETEDYTIEIVDSIIIKPSNLKNFKNINLNVFPNPSNKEVNISFTKENKKDPATIYIINKLGQTIFKQEVNTKNNSSNVENIKIDASNITSGIYFVKVITNNAISVKRITIQK